MVASLVHSPASSSSFDRPSIRRCSDLLGVCRSSVYKQPICRSDDLALIDAIKVINATSVGHGYGYRRMTDALRDAGWLVNCKRVYRLMREHKIFVTRARRNTSKPAKANPKYPYKLRGLSIDRPDQVWCSDITHINLRGTDAHLCCVMDWYSRRILSWDLSRSQSARSCHRCLDEALAGGNKPSIFNTDQGSQYTSKAFTGRLLNEGIDISHTGVGRCKDNAVIERFWRSLKEECIYWSDINTFQEAYEAIDRWIDHYNHTRPHQGLPKGMKPDMMYRNKPK